MTTNPAILLADILPAGSKGSARGFVRKPDKNPCFHISPLEVRI